MMEPFEAQRSSERLGSGQSVDGAFRELILREESTSISAWLPTDAQVAKRSRVVSLFSTSFGAKEVPGTSNPTCCLAGTTPVSGILPDGLTRPSRKLLMPGLPEELLRPFMQLYGSELTH